LSSSEPLIALENISFSYPDQRRVLNAVNLTLSPGQRIGLSGPNGCGKTTLLSIMMGLLKPQHGAVKIFGEPRRTEKEFQAVRAQMGFVFQDANDQLFCPTVADDIAFGPLNLGVSRKEADEIVEKILAQLHLEGFGPRVTYDLSGGEKKLISIGTALALNPRLLILDEPTNSLDEATVDRLEQILADCALPYLIVSHDREFLGRTTNTVLTMTGGRLLEE
jgi:cobalt/nickel transport system ATP-binding protein